MYRRIVFEHSTGLRQIMGTTQDLGLSLTQLPPAVTNIDIDGRAAKAEVARLGRSYVLYKEAV